MEYKPPPERAMATITQLNRREAPYQTTTFRGNDGVARSARQRNSHDGRFREFASNSRDGASGEMSRDGVIRETA